MAAPTMSYVIFTGALIMLIFVAQFSYSSVVDNISAEMVRRELKEIADYVSDTLANLYFLVNSTSGDVTLQKNLDLPSDISGSTYIVEIVEENSTAQQIHAYLKKKIGIYADSWILPGLMVGAYKQVESGEKTVVAGCNRINSSIFVWIREV